MPVLTLFLVDSLMGVNKKKETVPRKRTVSIKYLMITISFLLSELRVLLQDVQVFAET